jgi:hypothetical protein
MAPCAITVDGPNCLYALVVGHRRPCPVDDEVSEDLRFDYSSRFVGDVIARELGCPLRYSYGCFEVSEQVTETSICGDSYLVGLKVVPEFARSHEDFIGYFSSSVMLHLELVRTSETK